MMRKTMADIEQDGGLLINNPEEKKCKINTTITCCAITVTYLIAISFGLYSGLKLCQNGHLNCSYDDDGSL